MAKKPTYEEIEKMIGDLKKQVAELKCPTIEEEVVLKSEKRLSQIVQGTSIPTFVIDDTHTIIHCNKAFEKLTGISASEIIGTQKQWLTFYPTKRPVMADFIVDNAPEEELTRHYGRNYRKSSVIDGGYESEGFFPALGGKGKWLFFTAAPLKDEEGRIIGAIETLQDITERKRTEEEMRKSERRYRTLLDFTPYPIVVFTLDGRVYYLNPAFTETFGWTLEELKGKTIPYVPPNLEQETGEMIEKLFDERAIQRYETKRLTKDGRLLDVVMRGAVYSESGAGQAGEMVIIRNVTREKRLARDNEAMLRIGMALPEYPDLYELLDYVSREIKELLGTEGGVVTLLDEEKQEIFFPGAAYDDTATQKRVREARFTMDQADQVVVLKVIKTGEPVIVNDTSKVSKSYPLRDRTLGYQTKNFIQVALKSSDRIIGVLCAINKKEGAFDKTDVELLSMIAGAVALSIENARFSKELMKAYKELKSLNKAKDKVFHHLSHELKTPAAVLFSTFKILSKTLQTLPEDIWKPSFERAKRNLNRIMEVQAQVDDIVQDKKYKAYDTISLIFDQYVDELEALIAEEGGEGPVVENIRKRVEEIFGTKEEVPEIINLNKHVKENLNNLKLLISHRRVKIISRLESVPSIYIPADPLQKLIDGLIKNAIENTPDQGKIEVVIQKKGKGAEFVVRDYGVGIKEEHQRRIFEGFFTTQDTIDYSSKRPFDFNAGGKGADLLRMKIFSERYHFEIDMESSRCKFIQQENNFCPGLIGKCTFCTKKEDCYHSGGTTFSLYFPPAPT